MVNPYFTLTDSANIRSKHFAVILSGYLPIKIKSQSITVDLDGELDVAQGAITQRHEYMIKVRETEDRADYGDKADLEYFYELNDPNGSPSSILTLTDHFGVDHYVVFGGDFTPQPLGVMIEGLNAFFVVRCVFNFFKQPVGSGS